MSLDRDDLIVEFSRDGHHISWQGDADTGAVFTPDGDHLATFGRTPSGEARLVDTPGTREDFGDVVIDLTEDALADWAEANL